MKRDGKKAKRVRLADVKRLTAGLVHHRWPVLSTDGERVAYAVGEGGDATWVITDRKGRVARTFEGPADAGACFGPDGSFAFSRRVGAASEIWYAPSPSASAVRLLGGDAKIYREPALSPDGASLAFACADDASGRTRVWILDVASGKRRLIAQDSEGQRSDGRPAFGPSGELYFDGAHSGRVAIYRYEPESGVAVRLSPDDSSYRRPAALGNSLVLVEKHVDGAVRLVVLDDISGREHKVDELGELRDPACGVRDGEAVLVYAALSDALDGEPRRFDIFCGKLRGLPSHDGKEPPFPIIPTESASESVETSGAAS